MTLSNVLSIQSLVTGTGLSYSFQKKMSDSTIFESSALLLLKPAPNPRVSSALDMGEECMTSSTL